MRELAPVSLQERRAHAEPRGEAEQRHDGDRAEGASPRAPLDLDVRSGEHISRVPRPQFDLKKAPVRIVGEQVEVDVSSLQ